MVCNWDRVFVDTDMENCGKNVILKFMNNDGESYEFMLSKDNALWIKKALKLAVKLANMNED